MLFFSSNRSSRRIRLARAIAIAADALQIAVFPLFSEGFFSPLNDLLDLLVCITEILLVGWHIAFLPSFIIKDLPLADMAPTWTLAVWLATRHAGPADQPPLPPSLPHQATRPRPQTK